MRTNEGYLGHVFRRIALIALFMIVCVGSGLVRSETTYAKTYKVKSAKDWKNIGNYKGGTFKVTKNIKLTSTKQYLTIRKNKKYTIDLNGHTVSTTYRGAQLRTVCPLEIQKGTVILKSSKKNKGVLYSTETGAVMVGGNAKFYLKSGAIVNDAVEFRSDVVNAVCLAGRATGYIQGASIIQSIGTAISMQGNAKCYVTGHPYIRAGANTYTGMFTHYGCGIAVMSAGCKLSLKGGSIGTKATPDTWTTGPLRERIYVYTGSGDYPILDLSSKVLKKEAGYKYVDAAGNDLPVLPSNMAIMYPEMAGLLPGESKVETWVKDGEGYYTVYVIPG